MKILLTGASGFLGENIKKKISFPLYSLGRRASDIICDLSKEVPSLPQVSLAIHAAGKAHVIAKTEYERQGFYDVNVRGTINLLKGLERSALPQRFVFISSVAVYGRESGSLLTEHTELKAQDPYGQSKILAEAVIQDWCSKNNIICTILRLPLLAGKNPPGNLGAMIKGIKKGYYLNIAGGTARKSMVMADDVAKYICQASEVGGIYNLADGYHPSFKELSSVIASQLSKGAPINIPSFVAKGLAKIGDVVGHNFPINSHKLEKILSDLTFEDSKARKEFGWNPNPVLDTLEI